MSIIDGFTLIVGFVLVVFMGLIISVTYNEEEFNTQMDKIKGDMFSNIDKNTTNTEIVDMINTKCDNMFTDGWFSSKKTVCVRKLQDVFIISARD